MTTVFRSTLVLGNMARRRTNCGTLTRSPTHTSEGDACAATFAMASSTFWIFVRLRVTGGGVPRAVVEQCQLALRALGDLEADLSGGRLMKKQ